MLTSAVSSTSAIVAGVATASVLIAVLLFTTLIFREYALLSDDNTEKYRKSFGVIIASLAVAFLINLAVQTVAAA